MGLNTQHHRSKNERKLALTAIIPAYNERGRIGNNLSVLLQARVVDEIIVVDDGSTDGMDAEVLQIALGDPRPKLIRHRINRGKGQAVLSGYRASTSPALLLLDADLIGLTVQHVEALVQPVLSGEVDMTIGLFRHGRFWTDLSHHLTPWLSGQRCVRVHAPTVAADVGDEAGHAGLTHDVTTGGHERLDTLGASPVVLDAHGTLGGLLPRPTGPREPPRSRLRRPPS